MIMAAVAASAPNAVLINSPGGTGSTWFGNLLAGAGVAVNSPLRHLKHQTPTRLRAEGALFVDAASGARCIRCLSHCRSACHDRVLYVVADPARAVASTARRWGAATNFSHRHDLLRCPGCERAPAEWYYGDGGGGGSGSLNASEQLRAIFGTAAATGRDAWGVQWHFDEWASAQREDTATWPPILITDIRSAQATPCVLFAFVRATRAQRETIAPKLAYDDGAAARHRRAQREHDVAVNGLMSPAGRAVYANLTAVVERTIIENYRHYAREFGCVLNGTQQTQAPGRSGF